MIRWLELAAGWLLPPSARESVLGDFRERNEALSGYLGDALHAIPLVILSRMRRTADPETLLTEILGLYLAWLFAAWVTGTLGQPWALWLLAGPTVVGMCAMMLGDAWSPTGQRRPAITRAVHGATWTLISQAIFALGAIHLMRVTMLVGIGLSLFVSTAMGWMSPVVPGAPLVWETQVIRMTEIVIAVVSLGAAATWLAPLALAAL